MQKKSKHNTFKKTLLKYLLIASGGAILCAVLFYYLIAWSIIADVPSEADLKSIQNYTATEIYSSDGVLLGKYFIEDRTNVKLSQVSPNMVHALIATEDARFYEHKGVDKISMLRVLVKSIILGDESAGGGSTLSQQVIKNIFPRQRYWLLSMPINKVKEAICAQKLESIFTKKEILELYLNTVSFGENAFGVEAAAKRYFNIRASNLSIEQSATLVGLLKATSIYNPRKNPIKAKQRRNVVIEQMLKNKYITATEANKAKQSEITLNFVPVSHSNGLAPYFREHLRLELEKWCAQNFKSNGKPYNLYTDGLKIHTSIDSKLQGYAEAALKQQMANLQKVFESHWAYKNPWPSSLPILNYHLKKTDAYLSLKKAGLDESKIRRKLSEKKLQSVFSHQGEKEKLLSITDSVAYYLKFLHAGFVAIDASNAQIKAWVGGINHKYFQFDHVNKSAKRQVGSTFKPIVYAAAIEKGIPPCRHFENKKSTYADYGNWSPGNADGVYGGYYSMKGALTNSINTVSAQLIIETGIKPTIDLAQKMGIKSPIEQIPSIALGTVDASLLEMTAAYSTFANKGIYKEPLYLLSIKNKEGITIFEAPRPQGHRVMKENTAEIINHILQNVTTEGTASRLKNIYNIYQPIAGKTGTTQNNADGWFVGYTPTLVAGAWVGADDRRIHFKTTQLGQGANTALPIWAMFFNKTLKSGSFKKYTTQNFSSLSAQNIELLSCLDYIPPQDSMTFLQKLFGPKPNTPKQNQMPLEIQKKSPKYQDTWSKIRNMFKRNKNKE